MPDELLPTLSLSLRIALTATAVVAALGVPLAWLMARRQFFGKPVVETLLTVPLILPPTVVGYLIILLLGTRGPVGRLLHDWFGVQVLFSETGAVLASVVVSLPLLLLPARSAFAGVERELEDIARLYGAGTLQIFWHVSLPMARRGISSGLLLAFARSLGEFGATVMVFGNLAGRRTLPIMIYDDFESRQFWHALPAVLLLTGVSLVVMVIYNRWGVGRQE
jgi:molybdate transport system permease protein